MGHNLVKLILVTIFWVIPWFCWAQNFASEDFVVTQFGLDDGLPQSSVNDIIQTRDGYIWLATFGGLVRFDGNSFTTFNRSNTEGFGSDRILHLYEGKTGAIWLSTEMGFTKYKDGKFQTYPLNNVGAINSPQRVVQDAKGRTWALVDGIPYYFTNDTVFSKKVFDNDDLKRKALDNRDGIFVAYQKKVLHTMRDSLVLIKDFDSVFESEISDVIEYPKNSEILFISTARNGVYRYKNGELFSVKESTGFSSNFIKRLSIDRDSTFWVTTYNGISRFNGNGFEVFDPIKADYEINFTKIFKDNEGTLWLGTLGDGMFSAKSSIIRTISKEDGLENDIMLSLSELSDGRKLFSTNCGGIYEWEEGKLIYSVINTHLPNLCVWSIFEDSKNRIWLGAEEMYRLNSLDLSMKGESIDTSHGFYGNVIHSITEDTKGNIWIGALDGLFKYDGKKFHGFGSADGLSSNNVRIIHEEKSGVLLVGTISGLFKKEDERFTLISLGSETEKENEKEPYVRAIYEGEDGEFWIGSYGDGLFRLKDNEVCNITSKDGLFDDIVSHLVKDNADNFWMGSNRGISRLPISSASAFCDGETEVVQTYSYGEPDGMISVETNGGFQPSFIQDAEGNIYFPTVGGVAVVKTNDININTTIPPVYIERVRSSTDVISDTSTVELPYNDSFLEISYTAINFNKPEKTSFKYKLEGFNDNWVDVGNRREALYSKIPPGEYTFKVLASNSDGVWNEKGATIGITITPPFWQTKVFYGIVGLIFLTSGPAAYYYRVSQLKKENEKQKRFSEQLINSQEAERRRIASELHDGLGQQILVIKNRLELAKQQIGNTRKLEEELNEIMESTKISISDVRSISHALRPVHLEKFGLTDAIINLCREIKDSDSIEWSYHIDKIDGLIDENKEIHFYRVVQEGVNNIMKHSSAEEASVLIKRTDHTIFTTIWDDGKGFDLKNIFETEGLGFIGMKERVESLGGTIDIKSAPGKGTTIKINILRA